MDDDQPSDTTDFYRRELQRACQECAFGLVNWEMEDNDSDSEQAMASARLQTEELRTLQVQLSLRGYTVSVLLALQRHALGSKADKGLIGRSQNLRNIGRLTLCSVAPVSGTARPPSLDQAQPTRSQQRRGRSLVNSTSKWLLLSQNEAQQPLVIYTHHSTNATCLLSGSRHTSA